jgi:hypothetical protein
VSRRVDLDRYSVGVASDCGPAHVHTFATVRSARERIAELKRDGARVLWFCDATSGKEHKQ